MKRAYTASIKVALLLAACLFVFQVYRAATGAITPDEAWNYDRYIGGTWQQALQQFDLNNHILYTLLGRLSTSALGKREIALRIPSLLFGLLYVWAVWRLLQRIFTGWGFTAAFAFLILNPLVIDAVGEARGYGPAMALWLWALERMVSYLEEDDGRKLNLAAACLAGSVAACLAFIVPAIGLVAAFTWLARRPHFRDLYLPLIVFLFILLAIPLNRAQLAQFAEGATSLRQTLAELTEPSMGALPVAPRVLAWAVRVLAAILVIAGAISLRRFKSRESTLMLTAGTAVAGSILLLAAHRFIKAPFPQRGGIYLIPVLSLLLLALLRRWPKVAMTVSTAGALIYAVNFPGLVYPGGEAVAGGREIAKALRAEANQRPVCVATSIDLEPVVNYYRTGYRQGNWTRIERKPPEPGCDYYVLSPADAGLVQRFGLHILHQSGGMLLAVR